MFEPLNALERLLMAAATDPGARRAFTQALLETELYVSPAGDPLPDGRIGPMVVSYLDGGEQAGAVFTAPERVAEVVGQGARILGRPGRALLEELGGHPIQLNPNLAYGVIWSVEDINDILGVATSVDLPAGTQILLGHPKEPPTALIAELARSLGALRQVKGAWMLLANRGGKASWMLGVDHDGDWAEVSQAIGAAVHASPPDARPLEATPLSNSPLAKQLRGGIPIIAPKKRGLFDFLKG